MPTTFATPSTTRPVVTEPPSAGPSSAGPSSAGPPSAGPSTRVDRTPPDLRGVFRRAASSVWVVTTEQNGVPAGFTAISVVSVSAEPALVSFNVSRTSSTLPSLLASRRFAAHLLGEDQEPLARRFAGPAADRLRDGDEHWAWDDDGLPALHGVVARLSGDVHTLVEAGDSLLVVAAVTGSEVEDGAPLVHVDRGYRSVFPPRA